MNNDIKEMMEIVFNIAYLITIYVLILKMHRKVKILDSKNKDVAKTLLWAFALLAIGDTGHVGFRVVAYILGGLLSNASLVGYGKLASAITVTFFYMLMIKAWKLRFNKTYNGFAYVLFGSGLIRLIIMLFPANQWGSISAPFEWVIYRNLPLMVLGFGVTYLFISSSVKEKDTIFKWMGIMIIFSYAFYIPVILFAHLVPTIGILMIPKTVAYLIAGVIAYKGIFYNLNNTKNKSDNYTVIAP